MWARLAPLGPEPLRWAGAPADTGTGQATLLQLGGATFCVVVETLSHFSFEREMRLLMTQAEASGIMGECEEAG